MRSRVPAAFYAIDKWYNQEHYVEVWVEKEALEDVLAATACRPLFVGDKVHIRRIALNMPQVQRYNPPPNPAKTTDSRFADYQKKFGDESWELDALDPTVLVDLINRAVRAFCDADKWREAEDRERKGRRTLDSIVTHFPKVVEVLRKENQTRSGV